MPPHAPSSMPTTAIVILGSGGGRYSLVDVRSAHMSITFAHLLLFVSALGDGACCRCPRKHPVNIPQRSQENICSLREAVSTALVVWYAASTIAASTMLQPNAVFVCGKRCAAFARGAKRTETCVLNTIAAACKHNTTVATTAASTTIASTSMASSTIASSTTASFTTSSSSKPRCMSRSGACGGMCRDHGRDAQEAPIGDATAPSYALPLPPRPPRRHHPPAIRPHTTTAAATPTGVG